jgi:hypothetical protein
VLRGKTGTISGAYQLSGFVPKLQDGREVDYIPFVFLTDTTPSQRVAARRTQDLAGIRLTLDTNPELRVSSSSWESPPPSPDW